MVNNWGNKIKTLRERLNLTQEEVAKRTGMTVSHLSGIENSRFKSLKDESRIKLAAAFGMKLEEFTQYIYGVAQSPIGNPVIAIPILGYINAGNPALAEQQDLGVITVDEKLVKDISPERRFALIISGNSLANDKIYDGYTAIVERTTDIINGRVYVVKIDNQLVARHVHKLNDHLRLTAANGDYKEISATKAEIQGRIIFCFPPPIKL